LKNTNQGWMSYIQSMNVPEPMFPMVDMTELQLEEMYPRIYFIIYPIIIHHCDLLDAQHGDMHVPSKDTFNEMVESVHSRVSDDLDANNQQGIEIKQWNRDTPEVRDLISIILLRELLQRRRRPRRYPHDDHRRGPGYGGPGYGSGYWY